MKKILYFIPAIVFGLVYCLLLVEGQGPILWYGWLFLALMIVSGILLVKGKWWGAIPGVAIGILPEWQVGIALVLYYIFSGVFAASKDK